MSIGASARAAGARIKEPRRAVVPSESLLRSPPTEAFSNKRSRARRRMYVRSCIPPLAEKLLEVPQQLVRTALELELQDGAVVGDNAGETRSARKNTGRLPYDYRSALEDEQLEY